MPTSLPAALLLQGALVLAPGEAGAAAAPTVAAHEHGAAAHDEDDFTVLQAREELSFDFSLGLYHMFDADIDDGGEVAITRVQPSVSIGFPLGEDDRLVLGLGYEFDRYDFSGSTGFGGLDPWDDIHAFRASLRYSLRLDREWTIYAGPIFTFAGEGGASFDDAFTLGGAAGFVYTADEDLRLGLGIGVIDRLEDSVAVFPIITFDWRISDELTFRNARFDLGSAGGAGAEIAWRVAPDLELAGGFVYQSRRFRLDGSGPAPDGVGDVTSFPLFGTIAWKPSDRFRLAVSGGYVVGGELELDTSSGSGVSDEDFDPAPFVGARVTWEF